MAKGYAGIAFQGISRRAFLISSGVAAIAVAFGSLPKRALGEQAQFAPNAWVRVGTDNIVTIYSPAAEMGQGVMTAMPLLIAEEMDLDWQLVRVEQSPFDARNYGNPLFQGAMLAGASRTTRSRCPAAASPRCSSSCGRRPRSSCRACKRSGRASAPSSSPTSPPSSTPAPAWTPSSRRR